MNRELVARFVYEVCTTSKLPIVMYGNAMMTYHAFCEYTSLREESLLLGSACLLLAVKFGESILNSHACMLSEAKMRPSSAVIDATARVILWYGRHNASVSSVSVEQMAEVRKFVSKSLGELELSVLRIVGNYLTNIPSAFGSDDPETTQKLVAIYASPGCLNFPPGALRDGSGL